MHPEGLAWSWWLHFVRCSPLELTLILLFTCIALPACISDTGDPHADIEVLEPEEAEAWDAPDFEDPARGQPEDDAEEPEQTTELTTRRPSAVYPMCDANVALGQDASSSDAGWGGGTSYADLVDGATAYPEWWRGLAFTGGNPAYIAPCGERQATVEFDAPKVVQEVLAWHHGTEHIPAPGAAWIEYWDEATSTWISTNDTWVVDWSVYNPPPGTYTSVPTRHTFAPVVTTAIRFVMDNCFSGHGWIYELEVLGCNARKTAILVGGINTRLQLDPATGCGTTMSTSGLNDLASQLTAADPTIDVAPYSYAGGSVNPDGTWCAAQYGPSATANSLSSSFQGLQNMIHDLTVAVPMREIFIVGHSQGGLIGFQALGMFSSLEQDGRLRLIATLDAPLGGAPPIPTRLAQWFSFWGAPASKQLMALYDEGPQGTSHATSSPLACWFFGGCTDFAGAPGFVSNQQAVLGALGRPAEEVPYVVTFGAAGDDAIYHLPACGVHLLGLMGDHSSTQWVDWTGDPRHIVNAWPMGGALPQPTVPLNVLAQILPLLPPPDLADIVDCTRNSHSAVFADAEGYLVDCIGNDMCL